MTEYLKTKAESTCYGCRACEQICPHAAISMKPSKEGFLFPVIDESKCVKCGLCAKACPYEINPDGIETFTSCRDAINPNDSDTFTSCSGEINTNGSEPLKAFAGQYKNAEALKKSSSGGIFSALSDYLLENGGYVSGCVFNEDFVAVHTVTNEKEKAEKMRGSKYVQSDTLDVYTRIKALLENGSKVLFTGTPCQVHGLKCFLRKDYDNLFTVDLICHGVPSPKLLSDYLESERVKHGEITELTFRNKERNGWCAQGSIGYKNKVKTISAFNNSYYNLYLQNSISRKSCYECKYACLSRVGDITVGDFWGAEDTLSEVNPEKGISAILANTEKGLSLLNSVRDRMLLIETDAHTVAKNNGNLNEPCKMPKSRDSIYERISEVGYEKVAKTDCRYQYVMPIIRKIIPKNLKKRIKKLLKRKTQ